MPLRVDAVLSPAEPLPGGFAAALVIDVIRATTTAAYLLNSGVAKLVLTGDLDTARRLAAAQGALLAGERGGLPPEGFDLGNSPRQAAGLDLRGRTVVMTTTNGTVAAQRAAAVIGNLALGALVNAAAAARWAVRFDSLLLVAAGREGRLALDDSFAAGVIIGELAKLADVELSDAARVALELARADASQVLYSSAAARALEPVGLLEDVEFCARLNVLDLLPLMSSTESEALVFESAVF
ncbi:2-phosphosulfolactate phosphatase [Oceanithermus sp.]